MLPVLSTDTAPAGPSPGSTADRQYSRRYRTANQTLWPSRYRESVCKWFALCFTACRDIVIPYRRSVCVIIIITCVLARVSEWERERERESE